MSDFPATAQEQFEVWAGKEDFCLDQIFMSTSGVPENPYEDEDTRYAYDIWLASRDPASWADDEPGAPDDAVLDEGSALRFSIKCRLREGWAWEAFGKGPRSILMPPIGDGRRNWTFRAVEYTPTILVPHWAIDDAEKD